MCIVPQGTACFAETTDILLVCSGTARDMKSLETAAILDSQHAASAVTAALAAIATEQQHDAVCALQECDGSKSMCESLVVVGGGHDASCSYALLRSFKTRVNQDSLQGSAAGKQKLAACMAALTVAPSGQQTLATQQ